MSDRQPIAGIADRRCGCRCKIRSCREGWLLPGLPEIVRADAFLVRSWAQGPALSAMTTDQLFRDRCAMRGILDSRTQPRSTLKLAAHSPCRPVQHRLWGRIRNAARAERNLAPRWLGAQGWAVS